MAIKPKITDGIRKEAKRIVEILNPGINPGHSGYDRAVQNVAMGIAYERQRIVKGARQTAEIDRKAADKDRVAGYALLHTFADFVEGAEYPWILLPKSEQEDKMARIRRL